MRNRTVVLANGFRNLGSHPKGEREALLREMLDSPAANHIYNAACQARKLGLDLTDTEVMRQCLAAGNRDYLATLAYVESHERAGTNHTGRPHLPVVYYMRLGSLIKIGTSASIKSRRQAINPHEVVALEFGDVGVEKGRHRQFADLKDHGEWFRNGPELAVHMATLADEFERTQGVKPNDWLGAPRKAA
jgi:hypothetical protein